MKCLCLSDLHGNLPNLSTYEFDIVLLAGDICGVGQDQARWLLSVFTDWVRAIGRPVFACAGNHDWALANNPRTILPANFVYLQDRFVEYNIDGHQLKIWGSPWSLPFYNWAFMEPEHCLEQRWAAIPDDTDIVITHCPPYGIGDLAHSGHYIGSTSLRDRILQVRPRLHVFGHNHARHGISYLPYNPTAFINATILDDGYRQAYTPIIFELACRNYLANNQQTLGGTPMPLNEPEHDDRPCLPG